MSNPFRLAKTTSRPEGDIDIASIEDSRISMDRLAPNVLSPAWFSVMDATLAFYHGSIIQLQRHVCTAAKTDTQGTVAYSQANQKETERLVSDSPPGIQAVPFEDNLRYFNIQIEGPAQSAYEGGLFKLELFLPEEYPMVAPKVRFLTKMYYLL